MYICLYKCFDLFLSCQKTQDLAKTKYSVGYRFIAENDE